MVVFISAGVVIKLSEYCNKTIFTDHCSFAHHRLSGAILLILSLIMFYVGVKF